jgi:imidazole glycerol-phosphate synthase subunit HisH
MIVILDYGMGNVKSILNMVRRAGGDAVISSDPEKISQAKAIILPGVGAFDNAMKKLKASQFYDVLERKVIREQTPFLGICLGMHLLFASSDEGSEKGLGWMSGSVKKFDFTNSDNQTRLKIPHMGWNIVSAMNFDSIHTNQHEEVRFYFVHSYHVVCDDESDILAKVDYGYPFVCSVNKKNIWGVQFHPEKSHRFGLELFKNFLNMMPC